MLFGYYDYIFEELEYGVCMVWRNSNKCIGWLFWYLFNVFDKWDVNIVEEIRDVLFYYIEYVINDGKIWFIIMVFKLKMKVKELVRIWNY